MGGTREEKVARGNEKSLSLESNNFFRQKKMDRLTEWPNYDHNVCSHEFNACNKSVPALD
jgi:hypothetical protein